MAMTATGPLGYWSRYLEPLGDPFTDFVRRLLDWRVAEAVRLGRMPPVDDVKRIAQCLGEASSVDKVNEIISKHFTETVQDSFIEDVGRLIRGWHGAARYIARPELHEQQYLLARSWYLYMTAVHEIEAACGAPGLEAEDVLTAASWRASEGFTAPEVN